MKRNTGAKKRWEKPQLTIIVRGKPEEGVLLACKGGGSGPDVALGSCDSIFGCGQCDALTAS
jgi:hypothetical protein